MKNITQLLVLLLIILSQLVSAQPESSFPAQPGASLQLPSSVGGTVVDLVFLQQPNQIGLPVQEFQAELSGFNTIMADDFVIPPGGPRNILAFSHTITSSTMLPLFEGDLDVTIYRDNGGEPGKICHQETFSNPTPFPPQTFLSFTDAPAFEPGTYWISFSIDQDFSPILGQAFYSTSSDNIAGPNLAVMRNPGDIFGTGCTSWTPIVDCFGVAVNSNGLGLFLAISDEIIEEPQPIPTMGEWGLMVLGIMLLIFGLVAVNQKRSTVETLA